LYLGLEVITASRPTLIFLRATGLEPELHLQSDQVWHLFLSHIWGTGQDQAAVIKRQLLLLLPCMKVFLDIDDLEDVGELERYIRQTTVILIFLSRGYFASRNCLREAHAAQQLAKPLCLVLEMDEAKGGAPLAAMQAECPDELRPYVFGGKRTLIQWHRVADLQLLTLKMIALEVLNQTSLRVEPPRLLESAPRAPREKALITSASGERTCGGSGTARPRLESCAISLSRRSRLEISTTPLEQHKQHALASEATHGEEAELTLDDLLIPGTLSSQCLVFAASVSLWALPSNEGAREVGTRLLSLLAQQSNLRADASEASFRLFRRRTRAARLVATDFEEQADERAVMTHLLLYLNRRTWQGAAGEKTAAGVRLARQAKLPVVMVHERDPEQGGVPFDYFFEFTPRDLITGGLFKMMAIAWWPPPYLKMCALQIGVAIRDSSTSRGEHSMNDLKAAMDSRRARMTAKMAEALKHSRASGLEVAATAMAGESAASASVRKTVTELTCELRGTA